jgi:hypothetical protein
MQLIVKETTIVHLLYFQLNYWRYASVTQHR